MRLRVIRNPAYAGTSTMARKGKGKKMSAATKAYLRSLHKRRGRNPKRRHGRMPPRTASGRFRKRSRRNPTGHPLSGRLFRPTFHRTRGGYKHSRRSSTRSLSGLRIRRSRRGSVGYHRRRRSRNPASGYASGSSFFHRGSMGRIRDIVPLLRKADWTVMKQHKAMTFVGAAGGFVLGGVLGAAGGTFAILLGGFGAGVIIRYVFKGKGGKYSALAPSVVLGAVIAAAAGVFTSGSLSGHAALGATTRNLKMMAAKVRVKGLSGLSEMTLQGTMGVGQLDQLAASIQKQLSLPAGSLKLPSLKGLGDFRTGRPYSPVSLTGMGSAQDSGWSYSSN